MIALIILYTALFCYIRIQSNKLRRASSTSDQTLREMPGCDNNLAVGKPRNNKLVRPPSASNQPQQRLKHVSLTLLCYPIAYLIVLLPLSIARLQQFSGRNPSLNTTYVACAIFDCQGLVNVLLYTSTRKGIVSWNSLFRKLKRRTRNGTAAPQIPESEFTITGSISSSNDTMSSPTTSHRYPPVPEKLAYTQYEGRRSEDASYNEGLPTSDSFRNNDDKVTFNTSVDTMA